MSYVPYFLVVRVVGGMMNCSCCCWNFGPKGFKTFEEEVSGVLRGTTTDICSWSLMV